MIKFLSVIILFLVGWVFYHGLYKTHFFYIELSPKDGLSISKSKMLDVQFSKVGVIPVEYEIDRETYKINIKLSRYKYKNEILIKILSSGEEVENLQLFNVDKIVAVDDSKIEDDSGCYEFKYINKQELKFTWKCYSEFPENEYKSINFNIINSEGNRIGKEDVYFSYKKYGWSWAFEMAI